MKTRIISLAAIAAGVLAAHPAFAATTSLTEIQTGATNVQDAVTYVGYIAAVIGLVVAALHYFQHRDDLWGVGYRVLGSLLAGYIITHLTTIMGWSGTAATFP
jgi:hypothetical protein